MACPEEPLVHAYVDGEVDAANAARVEHHLEHCEDCRNLRAELEHMRTAIRQDLRPERAPPALRARLARTLELESAGASRHGEPRGSRDWLGWFSRPLFAALAGAACAAALVLIWAAPTRDRSALLANLVDAHARSLLLAHLIDVESSDHHTVKPWFAGRTDVSPPVADFAARGYRLLGGRADYLAHQRAAVLVYAHGRHVINVFSWSSDAAPLAGKAARDGYRVRCWKSDTLQSCAVSDTGAAELDALVTLLMDEAAAER